MINSSLRQLGWSYLRRLPFWVYTATGSVVGASHKFLPGPVDPVFYNGTP